MMLSQERGCWLTSGLPGRLYTLRPSIRHTPQRARDTFCFQNTSIATVHSGTSIAHASLGQAAVWVHLQQLTQRASRFVQCFDLVRT